MDNSQTLSPSVSQSEELTQCQKYIKSMLEGHRKLPTCLEQSLEAKTPSIARLRKMDKPLTVTMLTKLLSDFTSMLNLNLNMSSAQIVLCAEDLVDSNEFYMLRMEDYGAFFTMARRSELGKIEFSIDQNKIFSLLKLFCSQRDAAIARKRDTEQNNSIYDIVNSGPVYQIMKEVSDKLTIKEAPEPVKFERKQDLGQLFLSEWDKLPIKSDGGFVMRVYKDHEFFAVNDYLSARLMEVSEELREGVE